MIGCVNCVVRAREYARIWKGREDPRGVKKKKSSKNIKLKF